MMKKDSKWFINVGESNIFGFYWLPPPPRSSPSEEILHPREFWGKVFGLVGSNSKMIAGELVVLYKLLSGSNSFCSRKDLSEILQCRVKMAPTNHHPVIEHSSCANQCWWMVTILSCKHLNECNPMTKHPVFKNYVQCFHIIQTKSCSCVQFWVWEKAITLSYVVRFGYGKGLAHCMSNHVWLCKTTNPL
jgi:hypothetical protein